MTLVGTTASSSGLDLALTDASAWAETFIGHPIGRSVVAETLRGFGGRRLMVTRTPLQAVSRVFDDTDTGSGTELTSTEYVLENPDAGFIERDAHFAWTAPLRWNLGSYIEPASERRAWLVVYEAGWQLTPSTSTSAFVTTSTDRTLPSDIERAVLIRAAEIAEGGGGQIKNMKVGPLAMNYSSEGSDTNTAEGLLTPYRRVNVGI
jgi:hypothetical protein